jgi:26S proteasome regulatory subunit N2
MDVDKEDTEEDTDKADEKAKESEGESMEVDVEEEAPEKKIKKKREPEPNFFRVTNPARITKAQSEYCEFDLNQRYRPIRPEDKPFGVIMLTDSTPNEEEDVGAIQAPSLEPEGECAPPEPFEWMPPELIDADGAGDADASVPAVETAEEEEK